MMRSLGNLLDAGVAEVTPKRDPLAWIKQKAAEVAERAEQRDAAHAVTPRVRHLIDEAVELEIEQARSAGATGYIAHFLAQATLPHTDPKTNHFKRGTGKLSLSIVANPDYGVPYGGLPRLLLAWMCTEAVRTGSPDLSLGRSQAEFLQKLDLHNDGRYIARVRDQSLRLVHSMIKPVGFSGCPRDITSKAKTLARTGFGAISASYPRDIASHRYVTSLAGRRRAMRRS